MTEEQWMTIYRETVHPLYAYLARRTGGIRELSEDIVQETYLRALKSWGRMAAPDAPLAWLKRVALNILIDHLRRFKGAYRVELDPEGTSGAGPAKDPAKALDICLAVSALGGRKAQALELFYFDGKSVRQIASEMAISERAVEGLLRRARRSLRTKLPEINDNGGDHERDPE
ncbi:MAG: sigma-70 family RNA polymerase sigma factor [Candidatus Aminicenantes bacterium]|nr:sigma-70 family RNA polymerase sigma factor [Candidatus Aminicenantes bacterium]